MKQFGGTVKPLGILNALYAEHFARVSRANIRFFSPYCSKKVNKLNNIMICKRVSRDDVRAIKVGQTAIFTLPNAKAVETGRVQFSTIKRLEGMEFERIDTGEPLTIAYKRIK